VCMPPTTTFSALCLAWADLPIAIKKLESTQWITLELNIKFHIHLVILVEYDIFLYRLKTKNPI
jgi:hypothetical protein